MFQHNRIMSKQPYFRMMLLDIKYPRPKFLVGLTLASLFRLSTAVGELPSLRPNSYGSRAPTSTPTTTDRLRPDSYGSRTLPTTSTASRLRPDSYGSRAPSPTSTARKTPPGLLREPGSVSNFNCW